jgi:hypothetical protein
VREGIDFAGVRLCYERKSRVKRRLCGAIDTGFEQIVLSVGFRPFRASSEP